jgi:hypothetical protein
MRLCYLQGVDELATLHANVQLSPFGEFGQQFFGLFHGEGGFAERLLEGNLTVTLYDFEQLPLGRLLYALPTITTNSMTTQLPSFP